MFEVGDKAQAVHSEFCRVGCGDGGPDEAPEIIGKVFEVIAVHGADPWQGISIGYGDPDDWCAGCFRKIDCATDEFTRQIQACRPRIPELKPIKVSVRKLDPAVWGEEL